MTIRHCTDNFIPGLFNVADMSEIMGLFAPKPVVIVHGRDDDINPIGGARNRCHLVVGAAGHRFYADDAWPVIGKEIERLRAPEAARS